MLKKSLIALMLLFSVVGGGIMAQEPLPTFTPFVVTPIPFDNTAQGLVDITTQTTENAANTLMNLLGPLIQPPKSEIAQLILVVGGVLLLIAGWRVYEFITVIAGFLVGVLLAVQLIPPDNQLLVIIGLVLGGVIGAVLAAYLFYIAVFFIGAYIGILITGGLFGFMATSDIPPLVLLIGGIIGGVVMIGLSFEFLILLAAVVGAQMIVLGLGMDTGWVIILAIIGVVVQLFLTRRFDYEIRRRPTRLNPFRRG